MQRKPRSSPVIAGGSSCYSGSIDNIDSVLLICRHCRETAGRASEVRTLAPAVALLPPEPRDGSRIRPLAHPPGVRQRLYINLRRRFSLSMRPMSPAETAITFGHACLPACRSRLPVDKYYFLFRLAPSERKMLTYLPAARHPAHLGHRQSWF